LPPAIVCLPSARLLDAFPSLARPQAARVGQIGLLHLVTTERFEPSLRLSAFRDSILSFILPADAFETPRFYTELHSFGNQLYQLHTRH
jgi:hypothetical protein